MAKLKITTKPNCDNAPKMAFLRDLNIAFAEVNIAKILDSVSEDIAWEIVGEGTVHGKEKFEAAVRDMEEVETTELIIEEIITHGRSGALSGVIKTPEGSFSFCDVYTFSGAKGDKVSKMKSYVIEL